MLANLLNLAVPFVGAFEYFEYRGERRVSNLYYTYLHGEEGKRVRRVFIEPADGG